MNFTIEDLKRLNLTNYSEDTITECLEIFKDEKFYITDINKYFYGDLTEGQKLAKKFKLLFAYSMFSD